MSEWLGHRLQI